MCHRFKINKARQSRYNIGFDGTLARAPVWIGHRRGPPIYLNITKHNIIYKEHRYNIEKKILGAQIFFSPGPQIP